MSIAPAADSVKGGNMSPCEHIGECIRHRSIRCIQRLQAIAVDRAEHVHTPPRLPTYCRNRTTSRSPSRLARILLVPRSASGISRWRR